MSRSSRKRLAWAIGIVIVVFAALSLQAKRTGTSVGAVLSRATHAIAPRSDVLVFRGTYEARLDGALDRVPTGWWGVDARKDLAGLGNKFAADTVSATKGWPDDVEVVPLLDDAALRSVLLSNDEAAAAKALRARGIDAIAVHWRLARSLDHTGDRVLSRLYYHDALSHFSLVRVTDQLFLYAVLDQSVAFPPRLAAFCIKIIRELIKREGKVQLPPIELPKQTWDMTAMVRGEGRELAIGMAATGQTDLRSVLSELADDLERGHRRFAEWYGFPPIKDHIESLTIEVERMTERASVEPRSEEDIAALWELGIDGVIMRDYQNRRGAVFPGAVAYARSFRDPDRFLRKAASFHSMDSIRPWRNREVVLEMYRGIHFREIEPDGGLVPLYRGVPPIPLHTVTVERIEKGVLSAADWYLTNLQENGQVTYKFWPAENRYSNEYNLVRHTLATWNLVQAYQYDPRPEFIEGARRALDWTLQYVEHEGEMAFISYNDNQKLGSVVVALLGMVELAQQTGDTQWDEVMRQFGEFVFFMQEDTGKFRGYHVDEDHSYYGMTNDIVPGEAALSLVYLYRYFGDEKYLKPLEKYFEYYRPWYDEREARRREDVPWPHLTYTNDDRLELVQFGPWTVMAANAYHAETGDEEAAKFGLEIARWMIEAYQWTSESAPFPDYVGGYYKMESELPAMQAFCYAEGTAAAYQLALRADPDQAPFFEKSTREAMRIALQMQFDDLSIYPFSRGDEVKGGIRYALNETKVRIDYVHHALSSMVQYLEGAAVDPNLPEHVKRRVPKPEPDEG
jgi:hypothetical protein